ncbi:MAG: pyridoxal-dependent decarboxylase, partial [Myxococcota bacterium]
MAMIPYREAFAPLSSERPPSALSDPFDEAIAVLPTLLGRLRSEEDARPVVGRVDPEALEVDLEPPEGPRPWTDVAEDLFRLLRDGPRTTTRAFFNQLFGGRMGSAVVADMLASFANQSMYTYKVAGPQVLVEEALLARMGELAGFTTSEGTFTPGGSLSNLVAIVLARNAAFPEAREEGLRGRTPVIYVSEESHYSIRKSAGILGLGRSSVRAVSVDARGRLEPGALAAAIRADQAAGLNPFLAVATAGTTVRGAFDPIDRMSEVCRAAGLWLHVDGALGGSLLLSRRGRELLRGIESADSLTWDAHKLLGVPLTASVLLVRHRGALEAALAED